MSKADEILLNDFFTLAHFNSSANETRLVSDAIESAVKPLTDGLSADKVTPPSAPTEFEGNRTETFAAASTAGAVTPAGVLQEVQAAILPATSYSAGSTNLFGLPNQLQSTATVATGSNSAGSDSSVADSALKVATTIFKSGLGLSPLITGLFGLFSGGEDAAPPPLTKYALPAAVQFRAAATEGGIRIVDYDQYGSPREYNSPRVSGNAAGPAITVNVQAMDARSFLDRSSDIAAAVRDAMLNLNSINDVMADL
jgi:hypothetical protein